MPACSCACASVSHRLALELSLPPPKILAPSLYQALAMLLMSHKKRRLYDRMQFGINRKKVPLRSTARGLACRHRLPLWHPLAFWHPLVLRRPRTCCGRSARLSTRKGLDVGHSVLGQGRLEQRCGGGKSGAVWDEWLPAWDGVASGATRGVGRCRKACMLREGAQNQ